MVLSAKGSIHEPSDVRGITSHPVFLFPRMQGPARASRRGFRKREDLKQETVKTDQILLDQTFPGNDVIIRAESNQAADLLVAVIGQPFAVRDHDQEHIEQQLIMTQGIPESVPEKSVFDKGKAAGNLSNPMRVERFFFDHLDGLPSWPFFFILRGGTRTRPLSPSLQERKWACTTL